jgi:putative heme-binding domain-containing protein
MTFRPEHSPRQPGTRQSLLFALAFLVLFAANHGRAADPFEDVIRKTEPLTPEQEMKAFHLSPGFEAQLVACEPDIGKPMNMAFDSKGRLWITQSREYPFPVLPVEKPGRDKILVLDDFDSKGRARKIMTFKEGLNIPIGLYPYKDGVIAFTIPKIHYFRDTNSDGKADTDQVLIDGFGYKKDTHGLTSNFRRGYDGFVYADHGFNNDSTLVGTDGSTITMNSGNCYRFRPDGSHVEYHSHGQVNPFGLMFDPLGDLWSADCHSSPTYILLHGAYYPSFGKPDDGLGFAPNICTHLHGSTAISGMVFYDDDQFPAEYRWTTFIGNVMTCRINRDSYPQTGSTRVAKEEPDFLSSDDPWFRPVNLQLGPDGAIYIADFYNRIIGHYEVPLTHPGRDRERGRIWRIVYTGKDVKHRRPEKFNLSKASAKKLITILASPNITARMLAMDELVDRVGKAAVKPLVSGIHKKPATPAQRVHELWALSRLGGLDASMIASAATDHSSTVRVHAMRILAETADWNPFLTALAQQGAADSDPFVQRAAADALGRHAATTNLWPLLHLRQTVPTNDEELVYVTRMALRNQMLPEDAFSQVTAKLSKTDEADIADVAVAVKTPASASFLLTYIQHNELPAAQLQLILQHIARYAAPEKLDPLAEFVRHHFEKDPGFQLSLFKNIQDGIAQRGGTLTQVMRDWGAQLAETLLTSSQPADQPWRSIALPGKDPTDPWFLEKRKSSDKKKGTFMSSLPPGGERFTGILRSKPFTAPAHLKFFLAGHDGYPDKQLQHKNIVHLRDASTDEILMTANPPRDDTAQPVTWDLTAFAGKKTYLEVIDGDDGGGYAWLAIGRFYPAVVNLPAIMPNEWDHRREAAASLVAELKLSDLETAVQAVFKDQTSSDPTRSASARALLALNAPAHTAELAAVVGNSVEPEKLREDCARILAESNTSDANKLLADALASAPQILQSKIALALASRHEGAETLLATIEQGKASRRLLQDKTLKDRLASAKPANFETRVEKLTEGLPPEDRERQQLIDERVAAFKNSKGSSTAGAAIFKQNCMICHSLDGQGATIGPQLDGVGGRGADRLVEDILDPSRNVDPAFRVTLFTMNDGDVQTGLLRREEGEMIVVAEPTGKERSIPKTGIASRRQSQLSLMPDNFSQLISTNDFNDLIAYLLSKNTKASASK